MGANVFEAEARSRKVARLVDVIDSTMVDSGIHPHRQGASIAAFLSDRWGREQWAQVAVQAGTNPPSDQTRRQVIARYRARAEELADDEAAEVEDFEGAALV
jgi:hypothetical protein